MYRPCGYFVLVKMDEVDDKIKEGALAGFVTSTKSEHVREQEGYAIGTIMAFGPTAFKGFEGCESPKDWGCEVGDRVEFNRYDGKKCLADGFENYRLISDQNIVAVLEG